MRYVLLDRIDELEFFSYATGVKAVSLTDDAFEHHFPGAPVYPGALLIESMAQLGGALLELSLRRELPYCPRCVMSTVKAKFRSFARPGDCIRLRAEVLGRHDESARVRVTGNCDERRVCEAELLYLLLRVEDPALEAARNAFLQTLTRDTHFIEP